MKKLQNHRKVFSKDVQKKITGKVVDLPGDVGQCGTACADTTSVQEMDIVVTAICQLRELMQESVSALLYIND